MPINTFLWRGEFYDRVYVERLLSLPQPLNAPRPGSCFESLGQPSGLVFVRRKFVVVVVVSDVLIRRDGLTGAELALLNAGYLRVGLGHHERVRELAQADAGSGRRRSGKKCSTVQVKILGSNFRGRNISQLFD